MANALKSPKGPVVRTLDREPPVCAGAAVVWAVEVAGPLLGAVRVVEQEPFSLDISFPSFFSFFLSLWLFVYLCLFLSSMSLSFFLSPVRVFLVVQHVHAQSHTLYTPPLPRCHVCSALFHCLLLSLRRPCLFIFCCFLGAVRWVYRLTS